MNRRNWISRISGLMAAAAFPALRAGTAAAGTFPLTKSKREWQGLLPADAYRVLFEEATEPPGSSALNAEKRAGTFICAACNQPLFDSARKYESGTGWPSFWQPLGGALGTSTDFKIGSPVPNIIARVAAGIRATFSTTVRSRPESATATTASP